MSEEITMEEIENEIDKYIKNIIAEVMSLPPNKTRHCPVFKSRCLHFDISLSNNCEDCKYFKTWLTMKRSALKQNLKHLEGKKKG